MPKFKLLKDYLSPKKCMVQLKKILIMSSNNSTGARKRPSSSRDGNDAQAVAGSSSAEGFIPLAARDSEYVNLDFYNPHFNSKYDDDEDMEEEVQVTDATDRNPMRILFPGLKPDENAIIDSTTSTSEVTKKLVGQKTKFEHMRSSRKLLPEQKLTSVIEMPLDEETKASTVGAKTVSISIPTSNEYSDRYPIRSVSGTNENGAYDAEDSEEEEMRRTHRKRRKRRSDVAAQRHRSSEGLDCDSSHSLLVPVPQQHRARVPSRMRLRDEAKVRKTMVQTGKEDRSASAADDEQD